MTAVIWHNPACGTSRNTLAMIRAAGVEPRVIDYLATGWSADLLRRLARDSGVGLRGLLRDKEAATRAPHLLADDVDDEALLAAMIAEPVLVNRPIVETEKGVRLCRPSEAVYALLDTPPARFVKEDGEVITA